MVSVNVLGTGNVGSHLIEALINSDDVALIQVYSRNQSSLKELHNSISTTTDLSKLKNVDITIIAIPDDEIGNFSKKLTHTKGLLVHTSGTVSLNALGNRSRKGVFYPLQTFSKSKKINFKEVPICLEATNKRDLSELQKTCCCHF